MVFNIKIICCLQRKQLSDGLDTHDSVALLQFSWFLTMTYRFVYCKRTRSAVTIIVPFRMAQLSWMRSIALSSLSERLALFFHLPAKLFGPSDVMLVKGVGRSRGLRQRKEGEDQLSALG